MNYRESLEVLEHTVKEIEKSGKPQGEYFVALVKTLERCASDMDREGTLDKYLASLSEEEEAKLDEVIQFLDRLMDRG